MAARSAWSCVRVRLVRLVLAVAMLGICLRARPADADLLVTSSFDFDTSGQILRYDDQTGAFLGVVADVFTGGQGGAYSGMTIGPDGRLYVGKTIATVGQPGRIQQYDPATDAFLGDFVPLDSGGLTRPGALRFGPDRKLYTISSVSSGAFDDSILRYDGTSGAFIDPFVPRTGSPGTGERFEDFVFGPDGNLYATATAGNVLRFDGGTGAPLGLFAGGLGGDFTGLTFGPDGNLYVSDARSAIKRYDGTTGAFIDNFIDLGDGGLTSPDKLLFGPDGNLYVTDTDTNSVKRYDGTSGAFLDTFVLPGSGGLMNPGTLLFTSSPTPAVPEPGTLTLLAIGVVGLAGIRRRDAASRLRLRQG